MAQAADSPIGFPSPAKVPDLDPCLPLTDLHAWQASTAGLIAAEVFSLGSTLATLSRLAEDPVGFRILTTELAALAQVQADIGHLIARLHRAREFAA